MKLRQPLLEALDIDGFLKGITPTCSLHQLQTGTRIYIPRVDDYAVIVERIYKCNAIGTRRCHLIEARSTASNQGITLTYVLTVREAIRCYIEKDSVKT